MQDLGCCLFQRDDKGDQACNGNNGSYTKDQDDCGPYS